MTVTLVRPRAHGHLDRRKGVLLQHLDDDALRPQPEVAGIAVASRCSSISWSARPTRIGRAADHPGGTARRAT
ncbi:hypothetical protein [Streptomyces sp. NPDC094466]|uniref:hypothetical protein n=1 Tax=Streptomyces sp. NPDC094466 TaxID=3366065 RepID=UPI0038298BBF